jgi:hypothetical protein
MTRHLPFASQIMRASPAALVPRLALLVPALFGACARPGASLRAATVASAAAPASSPLQGTWALLAADEIQPDGARVPAYGAEPRGLLIVDADGRYSLQLYRAGRRRFASGDKRRGTPEEYADATLGMSAHTGRCRLDAAAHELVFEIELSQFPNWEGTVQRRSFTLTGDTLRYRIPASASGNGTVPVSEWRRLSATAPTAPRAAR